ncbi:MAG: flagellar filament capping protein FliD [Thermaerobacter sp.]|nr:flagellar filament capping protein FliD [Thermaerobacter sp.]
MSLSGPSSLSSLLNNPALLSAMYPGLNLSGLAQLYQAESQALAIPLDNITTQVQSLTTASQAWSQVQSSLQQLQSDVTTATTQGNWQSPSASSSQTSVLSAAVTSGGTPVSGVYQIVVGAAGQYNTYLSQSETSSGNALGITGSFSLNGKTVNVASTDSLTSIAQSINAANAGVTATVLTQTSSTGSTSYYLALASTTYASITVSDPGGIFAGTGTTGLGEAQQQAGQPWSYTVNGLQTYSATNTDSTTIPGLTLTLAATGSTTVDVTNTNQPAVSALQKVVSDYQTLQSTLTQLTAQGQPLAGDVTAEGILSQVNGILLQSQSSAPVGFQNLTSVGLTLSYSKSNTAPQLNFTQGTFDSQYTANATAVQNLFVGSTSIMGQLESYLNQLTGPTGQLHSVQQGIATQIQTLTAQEQEQQNLIQMQQSALSDLFNQEISSLLAVYSQKSTVTSLINQMSGGSSSQSGSSSGSGG